MFSNISIDEGSELPLSFEFDLSENANDSLSEFELPTNRNDTLLGDDTYLFYGYAFVVPMATLMVIIIILAVGGNVMVILTIVRHRGMRTRTNMFIVNLAVADILVAVLDMPVSLTTIIEGRWVFGEPLCKLNGFTMALFLICSIHTLMYISVHKFISITRPFSRAMTPRRIKMMILASWVWATFCATGPLIGWNKNVYKKGASQCGPALPKGVLALSHSLLITTSNYIIPLSVMFFCYSRIFREIHVHMKRIRKTSNIDLENSVAQQKKVATTLFLVLACFLLCWTPYVMYSNASALIKDKKRIPPILNPLTYWCGYLNSACNPIIYAFRSPSFRKGYKEIMCGAQSAKLSAVNSMSFRSRSGRGSIKSGSNACAQVEKIQECHSPKPEVRRQRTLLSQTSWVSTPMFPYLTRTFSTSKTAHNKIRDDSPSPESGWRSLCGFWRPRPSSAMAKTEECPSHHSDERHSLSREIKEEDEEEGDDAMNQLQEDGDTGDQSERGDIDNEDIV